MIPTFPIRRVLRDTDWKVQDRLLPSQNVTCIVLGKNKKAFVREGGFQEAGKGILRRKILFMHFLLRRNH